MYLSRIRFRRDAIRDPRYAAIAMGPYQVHAAIWEMFADESVCDRDFLYRVDESSGVPMVYALSERSPFCERSIWEVETKEFEPKLLVGQHLGFSLRVNPVVTRSTPRNDAEGGGGKHCVCHRHDVVMDMKKKIQESGSPSSYSLAEIVQKTGVEWLSRRAERSGFFTDPDGVIAGGYRQIRFLQTKKGKKNPVSISVIDLTGILEVTDPDTFLQTLKSGIGPAKGFGCGLMMIRPV